MVSHLPSIRRCWRGGSLISPLLAMQALHALVTLASRIGQRTIVRRPFACQALIAGTPKSRFWTVDGSKKRMGSVPFRDIISLGQTPTYARFEP